MPFARNNRLRPLLVPRQFPPRSRLLLVRIGVSQTGETAPLKRSRGTLVPGQIVRNTALCYAAVGRCASRCWSRASFLCRDEDEVREKMKERGLVERPKKSPAGAGRS